MSQYDLIILLNEEEELKNIKNLVESFSGRVVKEEKWERRLLAYPIKKNRTTNLYFWSLTIDRSKVNQLRQKLNFNEKILRYLLLVKE